MYAVLSVPLVYHKLQQKKCKSLKFSSPKLDEKRLYIPLHRRPPPSLQGGSWLQAFPAAAGMDLGQDLAEPLVAELEAEVGLEAGQKPHAGPPMDQRSRRALSVQGSGKRRCQDVGALFVFLSYWVGMLWIAALASREGDLSRLTSGYDYDNRMCGEDRPGAQFKSLPFVYYACLVYGRHRPMVCVSECPTLSGHLVRWYNQSQIHCDSLGHRIPATTYPTIATARNCVPSAASQHSESQAFRPRRQARPGVALAVGRPPHPRLRLRWDCCCHEARPSLRPMNAKAESATAARPPL